MRSNTRIFWISHQALGYRTQYKPAKAIFPHHSIPLLATPYVGSSIHFSFRFWHHFLHRVLFWPFGVANVHTAHGCTLSKIMYQAISFIHVLCKSEGWAESLFISRSCIRSQHFNDDELRFLHLSWCEFELHSNWFEIGCRPTALVFCTNPTGLS